VLKRLASPASKAPNAKEQFVQERDKRQQFRRLIDPGIIRPNSEKNASIAMQTLLKLAENLLREPDNPKYRSFKPTNDAIKARLIEPSGALEFALALGFQPEVKDFQPFYTWNPKFKDDLRIGVDMLREAVILDTEKRERAESARKVEKAAADAVKRNVALQYLDDRKTKEMNDEREKIAREARAARAASRQRSPTPEVDEEEDSQLQKNRMPGIGQKLNEKAGAVVDVDGDEKE